jgi:hypothetical protein
MSSKANFVLPIALVSFILLCPAGARAWNSAKTSAAGLSVSASSAQDVAARMVPAEAVLEQRITAKKAESGQQFQAKLIKAAYLKNGIELPRDTALIGTIVKDQMSAGGTSTLALRFTEAKLTGGKVIPIRAAIMEVTPPSTSYSGGTVTPDPWDGKTVSVDEPGVVSGFDFHGNLNSNNSGVFVSIRKDDLRLSSGSQFSLAIAEKNSQG